MRKITKESAAAFNNGFTFDKSNTRVVVSYGLTEFEEINKNYLGNNNLVKLKLFGHTIAVKVNNKDLYITNAGYFTNTTKERLNGLDGVSIQQKKGVWYLNGKEWDGKIININ